MFANVFRSQARLSLFKASRSAIPAARSMSSLIAWRALPTVSNTVASRTFTRSAVAQYDHTGPRNPPSTSLFLGNLPWSTTKEDIVEALADFGQVTDVRIPTNADGRPRGFAHVTFSQLSDAEAAMNSALEEPIHLGGRDLVVDFATEKRNDQVNVSPSSKLYFANFRNNEVALRQLLGEHEADVVDVFFMRDGNTGETLSTGFIDFTDEGAATEALQALNDTNLPTGETLRLSYARPKREKPAFGSREGRDNFKRGGSGRGGGGSGHYTQRDWRPRN